MSKNATDSPVYAGIITYNPDISRLKLNLEAILPQVDCVVIVDNHSGNIGEIAFIAKTDNRIMLLRNRKNRGVAKALNQIMGFADQNHAEWVLTLDQDSVAACGLIEQYVKYTRFSKIGMMSCLVRDRNAEGLVDGSEKAAGRSRYTVVKQCITSGCFTRVKAWKEAGGYDEKMFIDYVDFDLCTTLRERGYVIIRLNYEGLLHELGNRKVVRVLGMKHIAMNHPPMRKYYIVRNVIYHGKKHRKSVGILHEARVVLGFIVLTILSEPNKMKNAKAILRGIHDSRKM
ncbi:MAG: glycosyltransferase family 2 protein [Butyrivibrio sp.]|nr:glycosyltransferase family 2 protein [Butyrivibrio sp.]